MKNIRAKRVASKGQSGGWKHAGLLLSGVGISNLGDFIYIVAINLMVLNMTQSPAAVAGLWIISPIASVCTKFWSGSLIDRYDQRQLMIGADMLRALLVAALPLMSSLWMMYAVMFLISMSSSIFVPSSQVYITRLVPAERRKRFNSLQALISSGAFITGPAVAGVMLIYLSPAAAIYANAVSFVASALILMFLPKLGIGEQNIGTGSRLTPQMVAQDWRAVLSFSRKSGYVVGIYALFQIILVVGMSLDYFLFSRSFSFELAAVAFILLGLCSALANTGLVNFYQNNIPVDLMGRMSSVLGLVLSLLQVASILIAGVVAEQLSLRMVYTVVSGVMLLAALGLVTSMLPSRSRYYDEPAKPKAMVG